MQSSPNFKLSPARQVKYISVVYNHSSLICGFLYAETGTEGGYL